MGMFDTVLFKCPKCNAQIEEQSKAGDCLLYDYDENQVPFEIARSIKGDSVTCTNCNEVWEITSAPIPEPVTIRMRLIKP